MYWMFFWMGGGGGVRVQQMYCDLIISLLGLEKILVRLEKVLLKLFRKYQWLLPMNSFFVTCAVKKFTYDLWIMFIWQLENQFFASSYFWLTTFSRRVTVRWWWRHQQRIKCRPIRTQEISGVLLSDALYVCQTGPNAPGSPQFS